MNFIGIIYDVCQRLSATNRLIVAIVMITGERLTAVLGLLREHVYTSRVLIRSLSYPVPSGVCDALRRQSGAVYVFEHARSPTRHRTRQAVYKDIRRVCRELGAGGRLTPAELARIGHIMQLCR